MLLGLKTATANPVSAAIVGALAAIDAVWGTVLIAQVASSGVGAETWVPAGLTAGVTGVLGYGLKRLGDGTWVHRDPVEANKTLAEIVAENQKVLAEVTVALIKVTELTDKVIFTAVQPVVGPANLHGRRADDDY